MCNSLFSHFIVCCAVLHVAQSFLIESSTTVPKVYVPYNSFTFLFPSTPSLATTASFPTSSLTSFSFTVAIIQGYDKTSDTLSCGGTLPVGATCSFNPLTGILLITAASQSSILQLVQSVRMLTTSKSLDARSIMWSHGTNTYPFATTQSVYTFSSGPVNYDDAFAACGALSVCGVAGSLQSVESFLQEDTFAWDTVSGKQSSWLSIKAVNTKTLLWGTGKAVTVNRWASNEPSDTSGGIFGLVRDGATDTWSMKPTRTTTIGYTCEFSESSTVNSKTVCGGELLVGIACNVLRTKSECRSSIGLAKDCVWNNRLSVCCTSRTSAGVSSNNVAFVCPADTRTKSWSSDFKDNRPFSFTKSYEAPSVSQSRAKTKSKTIVPLQILYQDVSVSAMSLFFAMTAPSGVSLITASAVSVVDPQQEPFSVAALGTSLSVGWTIPQSNFNISFTSPSIQKCLSLHDEENITINVTTVRAAKNITASLSFVVLPYTLWDNVSWVSFALVVVLFLLCLIGVFMKNTLGMTMDTLQQGQLVVLLCATRCARHPMYSIADGTMWFLQPFSVHIDGSVHGTAVGVFILNGVVMIGSGCLFFVLVLMQQSKKHNVTLPEAYVKMRFPNVFICVYIWLSTGNAYAYFETVTLASKDSNADIIVGVIGSLGFYVLANAVMASFVFKFKEYNYVDIRYSSRYGCLYEDIEYERRWFRIFVIFVFASCGLTCTFKPRSPDDCVVQHGTIAVLMFLLLLIVIFQSPHVRPHVNALNGSAYLLLCLSALCGAASSACIERSSAASVVFCMMTLFFLCLKQIGLLMYHSFVPPPPRYYVIGETLSANNSVEATFNNHSETDFMSKEQQQLEGTMTNRDLIKEDPKSVTFSQVVQEEVPQQPVLPMSDADEALLPPPDPQSAKRIVDVDIGNRLVSDDEVLQAMQPYGQVKRIQKLDLHDGSTTVVRVEFEKESEALAAQRAQPHIGDRRQVQFYRIPSGLDTPMMRPMGICSDGVFLFVVDAGNHNIVKLELGGSGGVVIAGSTKGTCGLRDGSTTSSLFHNPHTVVLIKNALFVTDTDNNALRKIDLTQGMVDTVVRSPLLAQPTGMCYDPRSRKLFIADTAHHRIVAYDVDSNRSDVSVFCGTGSPGFSEPGVHAKETKLCAPRGVSIDPTGSALLFIADTGNHQVLRVGHDGIVQPVLGVPGRVKSVGTSFWGGVLLSAPTVLHATPERTILLLDSGSGRILEYLPNAKRIRTQLNSPALEPNFVYGKQQDFFVSDNKSSQIVRVAFPDSLRHSTQGLCNTCVHDAMFDGDNGLCPECDPNVCPECSGLAVCEDCMGSGSPQSFLRSYTNGHGAGAKPNHTGLCECGWYCLKCYNPLRFPHHTNSGGDGNDNTRLLDGFGMPRGGGSSSPTRVQDASTECGDLAGSSTMMDVPAGTYISLSGRESPYSFAVPRRGVGGGHAALNVTPSSINQTGAVPRVDKSCTCTYV
eukprot:PhF_6_TR39703/c0_g1_i1/m.59042